MEEFFMHAFIEHMDIVLVYIVEFCTILMELFGIAVLVYTSIKCFIKWIKRDHRHLRLNLAEGIALGECRFYIFHHRGAFGREYFFVSHFT